MDYSLAALKLMCGQLKQAKQQTTPSPSPSPSPSQSPSSFTLGGILFQRAWLQGILVSVVSDDDNPSRFLLDDGSGVIELFFAANFLNQNHWKLEKVVEVAHGMGQFIVYISNSNTTITGYRINPISGMYVMVVGGYCVRAGEIPMIKVHKIVDLSAYPDREAMWYLEVIEAYKLFYQPLLEE